MKESIQRNPFICGGPVPPTYFVGREREVRTIFGQIASPARGSVAISGDRRMGKTSLLQYVCDPIVIENWGLSPDEYFFVYLDCPTIGSFTPSRFWQRILTLLSRQAREASLTPLVKTIEEALEKETIGAPEVESVLDAIHRTGRALALLLDEFEWAIDPEDEHTTRVFLSEFRALTTRRPRVLSLVVATREELKKLCQPIRFTTSPFYNNFLFRSLTPFIEKEINQLLDQTLEGTGIEFGPEERKLIQELGGTHPYLVQLAGALVFDARAQGLEVANCLELITTGFKEQAQYHFAEVWEDSSPQEKMLLILFALCGLATREKEQGYDVEPLQHILNRDKRAMTSLAKRGLITSVGPTAVLSPPTFESWVLREIRSCDEREFTEYASLMFDLLAEEEAECAVEAMRLASGREIRKREVQPSPEIGIPPIPRKFKIFVSSTLLDLQRERQAVEEALHRMCTASSNLEYFSSQPGTPMEEVSRADVYVGIFAHLYGYIDPESGLSMTELEYRKARECNIPCLIYMMDESVPVPPIHIEQEPEAVAKLKALKQDLLSKHVVSFFTNPDNLAMQVMAGLNSLFFGERS